MGKEKGYRYRENKDKLRLWYSFNISLRKKILFKQFLGCAVIFEVDAFDIISCF